MTQVVSQVVGYDELVAAAGAGRPESWKKNVWTPEEDAQLIALMGTVVDHGARASGARRAGGRPRAWPSA